MFFYNKDLLNLLQLFLSHRKKLQRYKPMTKIQDVLSINGFDMYYESHGNGEPLLILHGFSGSSAGLDEYFHEFIQDYKLIIPDMRGHGRSTNPERKFSFKQSAKDILALLDHLKIPTIKGVGFSGGGCALLQMAFQAPERISSMAIVSAAPYFPQETCAIMHQVNPETKSKEEWDYMRKIHHYGDDQIRMIWEQARTLGDNKDDMNFSQQELKKIRSKTLIVQGDRDSFYPLNLTIDMYQAIPGAYLWIIPNGGHVPVTGATFQKFITYLKEFVL